MIHLPTDFKEFLQLLNSKKIKYLVVGRYAVALYGYPRATGDIDIRYAFQFVHIFSFLSCSYPLLISPLSYHSFCFTVVIFLYKYLFDKGGQIT